MRRRELIAGLGSAGVLAGAGAVAIYGLPDGGALGTGGQEPSGGASGADEAGVEPIPVETVEARGSEAGEVQLPAPDRPTFLDLFGTWCPPCIEQMPALAEAHDRIDADVLFISVTNESVGENGSITRDELRAWWDEHGGNWTLGLDPAAEVTERYLEGNYPTAVAIDDAGTVQWSDSGVKTADELVAGIERALEASGTDG